jgi:hypothetical protein
MSPSMRLGAMASRLNNGPELFGDKTMRKRILAIFALVAMFGLAIAAYAYTQTSVNTTAAAACCCKDSCPMKGKDGNHADHAKAEGHNCCGDSCPMKGEHGKSGEHQAGMEGHNCCGDSCPMKKKDGEAKGTAVSATDDGKSCCDNCPCCKDKAKTDTAAV